MKTILVLSSHPDFAEAIRASLNPEQYRVVHRINVEEAEPTRAGERGEKAPDALELADRLPGRLRCHRSYNSDARKLRASVSRTPFASPGSLPVKKA